ncbi:MAG: sugar kinase [Acidobacteria bacterium]|nr:sugar kinase [Acidobacteriota bacterium]
MAGTPLLVVGSVALDTVETPSGRAEEVLGGSATYFALAASYFHPVRVVAVVGTDLGTERLRPLRERQVDLRGLAVLPGATFRWGGRYGENLNQRETLFTHLNVFQDFRPELPREYRDSEFVFLGNIDPDLQGGVLDQASRRRFVGCDTMNFWIETRREALARTLARVDVLLVNDGELFQLAGSRNLLQAAQTAQTLGPAWVVVKRGEHGAALLSRSGGFLLPALPLAEVRDPTGAGDSFAGGFLGHLAGTGRTDPAALRRAVIWGTVMASFCVESFGVDGLRRLEPGSIRERYERLRLLTEWPREGDAEE